MWLIDRLFNRKIEGKSSLDKLEPLTEVADELLEIGKNGADRVQPSALVGLTHSFNELDPVLKQLIEDAITTHEEVACSQEQWAVINDLLNKSLYFNYSGYSLIKSYFDLGEYHFGGWGGNHGENLYLYFDTDRNMLSAEFNEV